MGYILQGTDVPMAKVQIKDDNGNLINLSSMVDYQIYVYYLKNEIKTPLVVFKKTPLGTDKPIIVVDATTQGFIVDRVVTANAPIGDLYFESMVKLTATSDYISSAMKVGMDRLPLCTIVQGVAPRIMI